MKKNIKVKKKKEKQKTDSKGEKELYQYVKDLIKQEKKYKIKRHILFKVCKNKNVQKNADIVVYDKEKNIPVLLIEYDGQPHLISEKTVYKDKKYNDCIKLNKEYKVLRLRGNIFQKFKNDENFKSFLLRIIKLDIKGIIKLYDEKTTEEVINKYSDIE